MKMYNQENKMGLMNRLLGKSLLFFALFLFGASTAWSQVPYVFSYQGVVRNTDGSALQNRTVSVELSFLQYAPTGSVRYAERHQVTTDANGLFSVAVGEGTPTVGSSLEASVNWANGPWYLQTRIDPDGATSYSLTTVQQMLSVPYALYAGHAAECSCDLRHMADSLKTVMRSYVDSVIAARISGSGGGSNPGGGSDPEPQPQPQPQGSNYSLTFDNVALEIGWSDFQCGQTDNGFLWLAQFANEVNGDDFSFPYVVAWFSGSSTSNFQVLENAGVELYKDTYFTDSQQNQYGDWQYYATNSLSCTAMDMTSYTISFTGSFMMYSLQDIVDEVAQNAEGCTKKDLVITGTNLAFQYVENNAKASFRKMNVQR